MRSKDFAKIFTGGLLIVAQITSLIGNANAGTDIQVSLNSVSVFMYDIAYLFGYYFGAIIGSILLIWGIVAHNKNKE